MSKSLDNYIGLAESPAEMFGKVMSISDQLMGRYYQVLLHRALPPELHPLEAKKRLGSELVGTYHSADAAAKAADEWSARFSEKRLADADLPVFRATPGDAVSVIASAYAESFSTTKSRTEVRRLMEQGSVQLDGHKLSDPKVTLFLQPGQILRLDKTRAVKIG